VVVTGVKLKNYRSYRNQAFELEPGVNIIVGPNASGKTNLLEAVYVAGVGKSFRAGDKDLISYNKPWARIDLMLDKGQRTVKMWRESTKSKEFEVGQNIKKRLKSEDKLPTVLFTPDDLRSLSGSPKSRRKLIDGLVAAMFSDGQTAINRFNRALLQRNHLLKQANPNKDELFVWAVRLGEMGGQLAGYRQQVIGKLNKQSGKIYSELAGKKHRVKFRYISALDSKNYRHNLDKHLQDKTDIYLGFTSKGPHRDDISVEIDSRDSQASASRGELRTLVLAAKIVETSIVEQRTNQRPLMLLDDVFSELDGARRQSLSKKLGGYQVIITTTDADAMVEHFGAQAHILPINS
jgi:DNA replication and repair protein RecF